MSIIEIIEITISTDRLTPPLPQPLTGLVDRPLPNLNMQAQAFVINGGLSSLAQQSSFTFAPRTTPLHYRPRPCTAVKPVAPRRRQCRIIVSATTADEVVTSGTASQPHQPQQPQEQVKPSIAQPHDEEDSEASVDAALTALSPSVPPPPPPTSPAPPTPTATAPPAAPVTPAPTRIPQTQKKGGLSPPPSRSSFEDRRRSTQNNNRREFTDFVADPQAIYFTRCGKCTAVYNIQPKILGQGCKVQCFVCENVWFQKPDRLGKLDVEKSKFIDYPVEKKDDYIEHAANLRRERLANNNASSNNWRERGNSNPKYGSSARPGGGGRSLHSVFIANLSYDMDESELKEVIEGVIEQFRLTIVKDPSTGRSKGFAFCDVQSAEDVEKVIVALDGLQIRGRPISARVGKKKE